ncbi:MAG: aminopeptidase P family protein [Pseudomonadota bacterium]
MFQDYAPAATPVIGDERLSRLRTLMGELKLDALLIPHADEQNNEYLPPDKERLLWLTGFSGSAGAALVACEHAVLFVDGRYTLQAAQQADMDHWTVESLVDMPPSKWLETNAAKGWRVGIDPWLHGASAVKALQKACETFGGELVELDTNPIDTIWEDQPNPPLGPVNIHPFEYAGRLTSDKLVDVQEKLAAASADALVVTDPSAICWLFNIRGADVVHNPVVLAHAFVPVEGEPILFIDQRKLDMQERAFLTQVCRMEAPSEMLNVVKREAANRAILLDPAQAPWGFTRLVEAAGGTVISAQDPITLLRAVKNEVEQAGARSAHIRDGAAFTTYLHWLHHQQPGTVDEIISAKKLEEIRTTMAGNMPLKEVSFDTISGAGPNGAIVHYRVNESTNRVLESGQLYLVDSGGQYEDGTTDITRTIAIGPAGEDERRCFTLVLRGHIALAMARFPKGTRGVELDVLARNALWQAGMDYGHGTGHGVGSYLAVHEGPQNISKRGMQELLPGMILSNEPGYYRTDAFGIRIENLVLVHEAKEIPGGDTPMRGFETLTLAPIDHSLIVPEMLTEGERDWLNAYHTRVRQTLTPLVSAEVADWLAQVTAEI